MSFHEHQSGFCSRESMAANFFRIVTSSFSFRFSFRSFFSSSLSFNCLSVSGS
uniref:ORFD n=2 Tax=Leptospira interrogans TaxID=173 RepID=Q57376_LEPIR|nr:ORFD [Leptospira interrogans serovar Icterohaemorrhagiae]AAA88921.1 ORFD [Leptospira interrogans serovar Pomona]